MADDPATHHGSLGWPDAYADLEPELVAEWQVDGDIYLVRRLSGGRSGAYVFVADLNAEDFTGQAILKFDTYPDAEAHEANEGARHRRAIENGPDFAEHLPKVVKTLVRGERLAILSTIAGRGLEYAMPWEKSGYDDQIAIGQALSRDLLEVWNRDYRLSEGLVHPLDMLRKWLDYRMDPTEGRAYAFARERFGLTPEQPTFLLDGEWFPNPIAFVDNQQPLPDHFRLRTVLGNIHGDLHGLNILVGHPPGQERSYYLIDLALYQSDQGLFYDHGYLELAHFLRSRNDGSPSGWLSVLNGIGNVGQGGAVHRSDDLGLTQLLAAIRREVFEWIDEHEANRLSHMESQFLLARVAAGLCFSHRLLSEASRSVAFFYAAQNLKELLLHNEINWPKYGPEIDFGGGAAEGDAPPSVAAEPADASLTPENVRPGDRPSEPPGGDAVDAPMSDKCRIAVLPLENLSGDESQEYFADGLTEDLVTELARIDWLRIVSHESTLAYRTQGTLDLPSVARELGVAYLVTGSVRKADDRIRVTAHLIEAGSGSEIWGERYDRKLTDVFAVQDEIARAVVSRVDLEAKIDQRDLAVRKRGPLSLWDTYQKAVWRFFRMAPDDEAIAVADMKEAVQSTPTFAAGHAVLALFGTRHFLLGAPMGSIEELERANKRAQEAVRLDPQSAIAHIAYSRALSLGGDATAAIAEAELSVKLNPSSTQARLAVVGALYWAGRSKDALDSLQQAILTSPKDPLVFAIRIVEASCWAEIGELGKAETAARQAVASGRGAALASITLATVLVRAQKLEEARALVADFVRSRPDVDIDAVARILGGMRRTQRDRILEDLKTAGLPNTSTG